jgi:hypothetical protein
MIKKIIVWFNSLFAKNLKVVTPIASRYSMEKSANVLVGNSKMKIKLRKYVSALANKMCVMNSRGYGYNKAVLVAYYDIKGLDFMVEKYNEMVTEYTEGRNNYLKAKMNGKAKS